MTDVPWRLQYFGEAWPSGVCDDGEQAPTPVGELCFECQEPVREGDRGQFLTVDGPRPVPVHRECQLRVALGGIGHLEDHAYWCGKQGDPDGGRTSRQSALEVWALIVKD